MSARMSGLCSLVTASEDLLIGSTRHGTPSKALTTHHILLKMGNQWSVVSQMFPPSPKWGVEDIPDLTGKVMIVTGAAGVGKETAKALLAHNAKVYIASRDSAKTNATIKDLKRDTGKNAEFLQLDLADLTSVRRAAEEFLAKESQLHVLFNNAAVMACPMDKFTAQGHDLQFGTNVLGHFHFTELLMPALLAASGSAPEGDAQAKARVITTASSAVYLVDEVSYDTLKPGPARNSVSTYELYNQTKFANVVVANELARRHGNRIVSISVNPGNLRTELQRYLGGPRKWVINRILYPPSFGALTQLWAGTTVEAADLNGEFLIPWARLGTATKSARDPKAAEQLWKWLEEQCKGF